MKTVEKYRDLASTLRERAELPALRSQRERILALVDHFDRLADEIVSQWGTNATAVDLQETCAYALTR